MDWNAAPTVWAEGAARPARSSAKGLMRALGGRPGVSQPPVSSPLPAGKTGRQSAFDGGLWSPLQVREKRSVGHSGLPGGGGLPGSHCLSSLLQGRGNSLTSAYPPPPGHSSIWALLGEGQGKVWHFQMVEALWMSAPWGGQAGQGVDLGWPVFKSQPSYCLCEHGQQVNLPAPQVPVCEMGAAVVPAGQVCRLKGREETSVADR